MRTDELRDMLHVHADEVSDGGAQQRVASVHDRVHVARRRRRAGVTGVVVAAVTAVALAVVPGLDRPPAAPADTPAPEKLAGWEVPATLESIGYTYEYVRGVESDPGAKKLEVRLPESAEPRLLAWASDSDDERATVSLVVDGDERSRSAAGALGSFEPLEPGLAYRVVVRQSQVAADDRLGLATYELSDEPPAGYTKDGVTYRQDVLGERLVGAAIGDPGETDIRFDITIPETGLRFSDLCYGVGIEYMVNVSVAGHSLGGSSCTETKVFDPGRGGVTFPAGDGRPQLREWGLQPGDSATMRVRMRPAGRELSHPVAENPDAVIGLGVYEDSAATVPAAGDEAPERYEFKGQEWQQVTVFDSDPGGGWLDVSHTAINRPTLVYTKFTGLGEHALLRLVVDGEIQVEKQVDVGAPAAGGGTELVIPAGQASELSLRVRRGLTDRTRLAIVLYEPVE